MEEDRSEQSQALTEKLAKKFQERQEPGRYHEEEKFFRWLLSRGVVAEVQFVGDAKPVHFELLKR